MRSWRSCLTCALMCVGVAGTPAYEDPQVNVSYRSTPDPPLTASTTCAPVQETLQGSAGYVHWTKQSNLGCDESRTWTLNVPPNHGVFIHVQEMDLRKATFLTLQRLVSLERRVLKEEIHVWREMDHTSRITVFVGAMVLMIAAPQREQRIWSSFNLTYTVYQENSLPRTLVLEKDVEIKNYDCSRTNQLPDAITCDGVIHCDGEEDEIGCEYRLQGCGDWVPYHNHCLKVDYVPSIPIPIDPPSYSLLAKRCQAYQGSLGTLLGEDDIRLVANMVYKSGMYSVLVNLHKVTPMSKKHEHLYRYLWQWGSKGGPIAHHQQHLQRLGTKFDCAVMSLFPSVQFVPIDCAFLYFRPLGFVCMRPNPNKIISQTESTYIHGVHLPKAKDTVDGCLTKQCEDGSVVQIFHQCQWQLHVLPSAWSPNGFSLFHCVYGSPVHYSLVCDGLEDCVDGSDERGCPFPQTLSTMDSLFICRNLQVIQKWNACDGVPHCIDNTDEEDCMECPELNCWGIGCVPGRYFDYFENCVRHRGEPYWSGVSGGEEKFLYHNLTVPSVFLDGYGMSSLQHVEYTNSQYFRCNNGLYIPSFLLNNLESDCPEGEDENIPHRNFTCPGFYRCQYYGNCVAPEFVCDGVPHCPNKDDETYCYLAHPLDCTCEGFACSCKYLPSSLPDGWYLRYLDISGVQKPSVSELTGLDLLQLLNVSFCQLNNVTLVEMPQLRVLDLSHNALSGLSSMMMVNLAGLTHLNVSGNALVTHLDASFSAFFIQAGMINIQHLVMAHTHVRHIEGYSFSSLPHVVGLDIRSDSLENYDRNIFGGLNALKVLHTDESRLCCSYFHTNIAECYAPMDELSSCNDLLRLDAFRVFLWSFSVLTVVGNCAVFIYRVLKRKAKKITSYHVLVSHLCIADLLMGVYMMIIGTADAYFRGHYVAGETHWKQSKACVAAGFLGFVSSEVSAFIMCLITLDRLLMLCFPFKPHLHLSAATFMKLGCVAWGLGVLLAAAPLMGQLEFYGESSLCLPLPITRHQFSGQVYSFLVFIVLNFLLFLFVGMGQMAIYWSVHQTKGAVKTKRQEDDSAIARRLFLVVFTDFCCWFPVGLMGLLAFSGFPIPGEVTVWVAVFVLPINSALNPFLYTFNSIREKRRRKKRNQQSKRILCNLKHEFSKLSPDVVEELMLVYMGSHRGVRLEKVAETLSCKTEKEISTGGAQKFEELSEERTRSAGIDDSQTRENNG